MRSNPVRARKKIIEKRPRLVKHLFNYLTIPIGKRARFPYHIDMTRRAGAARKATIEQRAKVFKALSDPTRLRIVEMLVDCKGMCGSEIAGRLNISLALLCHHWKTLEHVGLITKRKEGQTASISLNYELLADCFKSLVD